MKEILQYLFEHKTLSRIQAKELMAGITKNIYNETEVASLITIFLMRSITIDELQGFKDALLEVCINVDLEMDNIIDIVGTGGDGKNTFNISTLACFIVAGTGNKVTKHGNYGVSSISGSSNVLENLGYKFKTDISAIKKELDETNFCFLHAPLFHPALKNVSTVRKNLGIRTIFNMLGPLVNPAQPHYQLIGVYNLEMARIYNYILQQNKKPFTIVYSLDGYDEISLTADIKVISKNGEEIKTPEELGKRMVLPVDILGGANANDNAKMFVKILKGEGSWAQMAVVLANAATALYGSNCYNDYESAYQAAIESLESGNAYKSFQKLMSIQS